MAQASASINDMADDSPIDCISQTQKERLFFIEFRLQFLGSLNRNDLVQRFGIKEAAASRDFSLYKQLAPKNIEYDVKAKKYSPSPSFLPIFNHETSQALVALQFGFGDDFVGIPNSLIPSETPNYINFPNLKILSEVTKSIHQNRVVKVEYRSLSSGLTTREIAPFALVNNGLRWHVRAFDRLSGQFRDFVINRFVSLSILDEEPGLTELSESDKQWNRIVELQIIPHPKLAHSKTIETEYGMQNGILSIEVRAAVAGYLLRHWNIDCSEEYTLQGAEMHLWLKNREALYGVENLVLAPGYEASNTNEQLNLPYEQ